MNTTQAPAPGYEVRFDSLFNKGNGLAFPCDALGRVNIDQLTEMARNNYFFARALMGRDFASPWVCRVSRDDSRSLLMKIHGRQPETLT